MPRFSTTILVLGLALGSPGCGSAESPAAVEEQTDSSVARDTADTPDAADAPVDSATDTDLDTELVDAGIDTAVAVADTADEADAGEETADAAGDAAFDAAADAGFDAAEADVRSDAAEADVGPPVRCTAATINDVSYGTSSLVRQGYGPIQLNVVGDNLAAITSASLGPISCAIILKTATTALVSCNVAHGAALGAHALVLSNGASSGACAAAVTVTKITVDADAMTASDSAGLGTPFRPFRSIGRGLSVSGAGDVVYVDANGTGSYSVSGTGETFVPLGTSTDPLGTFTANVPSGVTIEGDTKPSAVTRITGAKNDPYAVFKLEGSATIKHLQLDGFRFGVIGSSGTIAISNVSIRNSGGDAFVFFGGTKATIDGICDVANVARHGLLAAGTSTTTVTDCAFHNHDANAILVRDTATVTATTIKVYANGKDPGAGQSPGVLVVDGGTLRMTTSEVYGNYQGGIFGQGTATIDLLLSKVFNNGKRVGNSTAAPVLGSTRFDGVRMIDGKTLSIAGGQIYDNGASGVGVYETGASALSASLNGVNIQSNFYDGLRFDCDGRLTVRNTIFEDNAGNGVQIENSPALVDFGSSSTTGGNTFRRLAPSATPGVAGAALLGDFRPARLLADGVVITVGATTFQTITPAAATRTGPTSSVVSGQLLYEIANANNRIQFY